MTHQFLNASEVLLIECIGADGRYFSETAYFGDVIATARDVDLGDDAVAITRYDRETMTGEGVTEELASAYLANHPHIEPESPVPPYVAESEAWADFCEQWVSVPLYTPAGARDYRAEEMRRAAQ